MFKFSKVITVLAVSMLCLIGTQPSLSLGSAPMLTTVVTDKVDGNKPVGEQIDVFQPDTEAIYVTFISNKLKEGQTLTGIWVAKDAVDSNGQRYQNFTIGEPFTLEVKAQPGEEIKSWDGKFTLIKPTAGWPIGEYYLAIYLDDEKDPLKVVDFKVANANSKPQE